MVKELSKKIYKDTSLVAASNIVNYASTFILAVFISRMLGVEALGQFTYIFAFTTVFSVITDFGFSTLLVRKVNENRSKAWNLIKRINLIKIIIGNISVILLLTVIYFAARENFNFTFAAGIAVIIPKAIQSTHESAIRALLKQFLPAVIKSANSLLQLGAAYFLIINSFGLLEIFIMILLTEAATAIVLRYANSTVWKRYIIIPDRIGKKDLFSIKLLLRESWPFFGKNFLSHSIPRITVILLGYISSALALGVFSAASRFANGIGLISGALFNTYYPVVSHPDTTDNSKYELTGKFIFYAFGTGLLAAAALFFLSGPLIDFTFKIEEAKPVLKILAFTVIPILVYTVIHSYLFSIHKEKFILILYSSAWIANIVLSIILISLHNYTGAAIATIIVEYSLMIALLIKFYILNAEKRKKSIIVTSKVT